MIYLHIFYQLYLFEQNEDIEQELPNNSLINRLNETLYAKKLAYHDIL